MMWFGLMALFGPISVLLDILPVFGAISRSLIAIVTFLTALVLTTITVIVSMIVHSLIALIITLTIFVGAIVAFFVIRKKRKQPQVNPH